MAGHVKDIDHGLKAILEELRKAPTYEVVTGIQEGSANASGKSIAQYAAANEYGATIDVEAHSQTIYRRIRKSGDFSRGGRFVKAARSNYATTAQVGPHKITIPARPFMRPAFDENIDTIEADAGRAYSAIVRGAKIYDELVKLGIRHVQRIKAKIRSNVGPPNAPSTVRKKKSDKTLRDKGAMINSVQFLVRQKTSGGEKS